MSVENVADVPDLGRPDVARAAADDSQLVQIKASNAERWRTHVRGPQLCLFPVLEAKATSKPSGSTTTDVFSRLKSLEERILFLETLSPEYFTSGPPPAKKQKKEEKGSVQTGLKEITLQLSDVCEQPEDDVCEQSEDDVCEQPEDDVCEQPEDNVCEQPADDVCEQPADDVCEQPEDDVCEQPEDDVCEQPVDDVCEQSVDDVESDDC
ncbi:hypothetical protein MAR_001297 [Mya arenaria]|uniref:Uncharacterized protein n=1 Tax=Mya arenaria TaxID=6604 RepID=A0ABY7FF03_MYAAR|nr:hypothetical protein MAR_001297 [Mya arenaria]